MANSRIATSSITQGFPKSRSMLTGNDAIYAGSYESIATVTVGAGGSSSISFSSIPSTYTHLQLRSNVLMSGTNYGNVRFNSDTPATNYYFHQLYGNGSSALTAAGAGQYLPTNNNLNSSYAVGAVTDILDYANTNKYKTTRNLEGQDANGTGYMNFSSGLWMSTAAITAITITPSANTFKQYSSFALYGIK